MYVRTEDLKNMQKEILIFEIKEHLLPSLWYPDD